MHLSQAEGFANLKLVVHSLLPKSSMAAPGNFGDNTIYALIPISPIIFWVSEKFDLANCMQHQMPFWLHPPPSPIKQHMSFQKKG